MIDRLPLEQRQIWIYLGAIGAGCLWGWTMPGWAPYLEMALWPVVGFLLYVTFAQVSITSLRGAASDRRFLAALLVLNFLWVPAVVWMLTRPIRHDPVLCLGAFLVLLAPCTDWYVSFTFLGKGDAHRAIASTPLLLAGQMIALPAYLWLFQGAEFTRLVQTRAFLEAFAGLIFVPLLAAWATERAARRSPVLARWSNFTRVLPVPVLALTVWLIAAAQAELLARSLIELGAVTAVFIAYAIVIPFVARWTGRRFQLDVAAQRTLVFSAGTRNSFVVLPLALALPESWQLVVPTIVVQSMIELLAMIGYLRWVPTRLLPCGQDP
ncbi:MAG: arsenic resistance protein [Verrucomicrobiota bacterium]|nr:hypothetical protein [Limisphaera sp.]MDW8380610.1 arsenic resistance protein [Verrucomicrobiota bacterium]